MVCFLSLRLFCARFKHSGPFSSCVLVNCFQRPVNVTTTFFFQGTFQLWFLHNLQTYEWIKNILLHLLLLTVVVSRGTRSRRGAQTSVSPGTPSSSSWDPRCPQTREDIVWSGTAEFWICPVVSYLWDVPGDPLKGRSLIT